MFSILSRRCPLLATSCPSFSVCFPCSSPIPGLIWFGSVYLVTTAGFVADRVDPLKGGSMILVTKTSDQTRVCVCYIQFAGYTSVYFVPGVCNSYVESNSVLLVANDDTISAVSPTRRGAHEKTYGIWNRRRNVYASLEVWMLWLGCLSITTVHGAYV